MIKNKGKKDIKMHKHSGTQESRNERIVSKIQQDEPRDSIFSVGEQKGL